MALRLSPRVLVFPAGTPCPSLGPGEVALAQVRGHAFGDGSHPTTRLCAGALDFLCRTTTPASVLDVGTGTGVLARIARARGARAVLGTDIDPAALEEARANARLDEGFGDILFATDEPDAWGAKFDLVVANILEGPLRELAPALARSLAPGGVLLLSGFTRLQVPALRSAFEAQRLRFRSESFLEEWALLMFER